MGIESADRHRDGPRKQRSALPWVIGALVLAAGLFAASSRGHRMPGAEQAQAQPETTAIVLPGTPTGTLQRTTLYPADDPWQGYLADDRTCPGGERTDLPVAQQEQVMICLINWARARHALTSLPDAALLASTALQKADEIVRCQNFSHSACGSDPAADIHAAGYHGAFGENLYIAGGRSGAPRVALDGWLNSPEHRDNLFRREWRIQGIALIKLPVFGQYRDMSLWVSHFGSE